MLICDSSARLVAGGEDDGVEVLESAFAAEHEVAPIERLDLVAHQTNRSEQQRGISPGCRTCKADTHQTSLQFTVGALVGEGSVAYFMQHRTHIICQRDAGT